MHIELSKDKRYYSIGEVAKAFDVNASLIRFWDNEFPSEKSRRTWSRRNSRRLRNGSLHDARKAPRRNYRPACVFSSAPPFRPI